MTKLDISKIRAKLDGIAEGFANKAARVGIFEGATYPDGQAVATVGAAHEFGAPEQGIPPRPFMRPTADAQAGAWSKVMAEGVRAVARGKATAVDVLDGVGQVAAQDVREAIDAITTPPLKEATIRRKAGNGANPIVGRMRQADETGHFAQVRLSDVTSGKVAAADVSGKTQPLKDTGTLIAHIQHAVGNAEE